MNTLRSALNRLRATVVGLPGRFEFDPRGLVPAALLVVSIVLLIAKLSTSPNLFVGKQSFRVQGRLICCTAPEQWAHGNQSLQSSTCRPTPNVAVELYDYDYLTPDDLLNETHTDAGGRFEMSAVVDEIATAWPYILVYTRCDVDPQFHQPEHSMKERIVRKGHYAIPQHYINSGDMVYQLDPLNLATRGWRDFHS